jgi:hypothetical protein
MGPASEYLVELDAERMPVFEGTVELAEFGTMRIKRF